MGDTVKKVIESVTGNKIKPCGGCQKRREMLNKMLPYTWIAPDDYDPTQT